MRAEASSSNNPGHEQSPVVIRRVAGCKLLDGAQHGIEQAGRSLGTIAQNPVETSQSEHLSTGVMSFRDSVGVKDDLIARIKQNRAFLVVPRDANPKRQAVDPVQGGKRSLPAALQPRRIVAGRGVAQFATSQGRRRRRMQ